MILQRGEGNRSWSTECIAIVDFIIITPYFIVSVRGCLIVSLSFCISLSHCIHLSSTSSLYGAVSASLLLFLSQIRRM